MAATRGAARVDDGRRSGCAPRAPKVNVGRAAALGLSIRRAQPRIADGRILLWIRAVGLNLEALERLRVEDHVARRRAPHVDG